MCTGAQIRAPESCVHESDAHQIILFVLGQRDHVRRVFHVRCMLEGQVARLNVLHESKKLIDVHVLKPIFSLHNLLFFVPDDIEWNIWILCQSLFVCKCALADSAQNSQSVPILACGEEYTKVHDTHHQNERHVRNVFDRRHDRSLTIVRTFFTGFNHSTKGIFDSFVVCAHFLQSSWTTIEVGQMKRPSKCPYEALSVLIVK